MLHGRKEDSMLVKRIAACTIYLQLFPSNSPVSSKVCHFSTLFAHFHLPWVHPWDNRGKCYMDGKRIQCLSNASQHVSIYLQPFTSFSEILVGNCNFFYSLAFNAAVGGVPIGIPGKRLVMGLPGSEDSLTIGWAVSTQYQRVTDRRPAYSYNVRSMTDTC